MEIIPGKGSGLLKKHVLRFLDPLCQAEVKALHHRSGRTATTTGGYSSTLGAATDRRQTVLSAVRGGGTWPRAGVVEDGPVRAGRGADTPPQRVSGAHEDVQVVEAELEDAVPAALPVWRGEDAVEIARLEAVVLVRLHAGHQVQPH